MDDAVTTSQQGSCCYVSRGSSHVPAHSGTSLPLASTTQPPSSPTPSPCPTTDNNKVAGNSHPLFFTVDHNTGLRFLVDTGAELSVFLATPDDISIVNARTHPDRYLLPHIHDFTATLADTTIYLKTDLIKAYH